MAIVQTYEPINLHEYEVDFWEDSHISCDDYGIIAGCDEECPPLSRGECKVPEEVLINVEFNDPEFRKELLEIYGLKEKPKFKTIW